MIIANTKPGMIILPYTVEAKNKLMNTVQFNFLPGNNVMQKAIWEKIKKECKDSWKYWGQFLNPITEDDKVDVNNVSEENLLRYIEGVIDSKELMQLHRAENEREEPRPVVFEKIAAQTKRLDEIEKKKADAIKKEKENK